jgi:hypothetical protein
MQVEVSKYTVGNKDTVVRPNGLPESLIKYDGTRALSLPYNLQNVFKYTIFGFPQVAFKLK